MEDAKPARRGDLFRYDLRISANAVNRAITRWHDRAIALAVLVMGITALRSWFRPLEWQTATWIAVGLGLLAGIGSGGAIRARLESHSADGPLAAEALSTGSRRRYAVTCHLAALALLLFVSILVRPSLLACTSAGYVAGAAVAQASALPGLPAMLRNRPRREIVRVIKSWLREPRAGAWAAAVLIASLVLLHQSAAPRSAVLPGSGILAALLVSALTMVDDQVIRFMAMAGHGSRKSVWRHIRGLTLFMAISIPVCTLGFGPEAGGIVAAVGLGALLLLVLRVLAYRVHGKRLADLLLLAGAGMFVLAASSAPFLLPPIFAMMLWHMQRQASRRSWLIE
jgi:hypothetical protein